jgi:hypothetical protein
MTKLTEHDAFTQLERAIKATREANGDDFLRDLDDLAPSRAWVWLLCFFAVAAVAMVLAGCGGGIDTPDEFMGPPAPSTKVEPPRPCPQQIECRSEPLPG